MRSVAGLFIGNNGNDLHHAERDALAMRNTLASSRGIIATPANAIALTGWRATRANVEHVLASMAERRQDAFVLFVAGHGSRRGVSLADDFFSFQELRAWLRLFRARHIIVVLDTCGAGGLVDMVKSGGLGGLDERVLEPVWLQALAEARAGMRILAAVRADQSAREPAADEGRHGYFSFALLKALRSLPGSYRSAGHGLVSDRDITAAATREMRALFGRKAVPQILGDAGPIPLMVSDVTQVFGRAEVALRANGGRARAALTTFDRRFLPTALHLVLETADGREIWSGSDLHLPEDAIDSVSYEIDASAELRGDVLLRLDRAIAPYRERTVRWRAYSGDERGRSLGLASIVWTRDPYLPRRYLRYYIPG